MLEKRESNQPAWKATVHWVGIAVLFILAILLRIRLQDISLDMEMWLIPWYDYIQTNGIFTALGKNFSNYTPPYTYLLSLVTLIPIPKVIAIKLISVTMDFINAFVVYKIVRHKYSFGVIPIYAALGFLCLPTVFMNSAIWGQADGIYTGFLLIALCFFLKERPFWGMLAFSVAFTFKAQAVFMAPFLAILFLRSFIKPDKVHPTPKIRFWHFFLVPSVYIFLCLPVVLLGRSLGNVLAIYLHQGAQYHFLSANAPNLYIFIPDDFYTTGVWAGLFFAVIGVGLWVVFTLKSEKPVYRERLVLMALISVGLTPFLLPLMHDRYFYPADVFSLVLAFLMPEVWFLPVAYQLISSLSYVPFLMGFSKDSVFIAAIVNTVVVLFLLVKQYRFDVKHETV